MSYPDIKTFLSSCRLEAYAQKFVEMGFDDVEFLVHCIFSSSQQVDDLVRQTGLKPGHLMKLHAAIEKYKVPPSLPRGGMSRPYADVVTRSSPPVPLVASPTMKTPARQPIVKQVMPKPSPSSLPVPVSPLSFNQYGSFSESQLDGQMEDLERSLHRLLDTGDVSESDRSSTDSLGSLLPSSKLSSSVLSSSVLSSMSPSPSPSSDSPSSGSGSPTSASILSSSFLSPPKLPPQNKISPMPPKLPDFEVVKTKSSKKLKKKAAKANLGFCPDGLFCTERLNCKLLHDKDETLFFRNPVSKTKACTRNLGGVCDKHPDNCGYAHSAKDARCLRCRQRGHFVGQCPQTKTRPCRRKNGGVCDRDPLMCGFAHSKKDARCLSCKERGHFYDQCPEKIP